MELSNVVGDFVGSNTFSVLMLLAVVGGGLFLRFTFRVPDSEEYKHRREE